MFHTYLETKNVTFVRTLKMNNHVHKIKEGHKKLEYHSTGNSYVRNIIYILLNNTIDFTDIDLRTGFK